MHPIFAAIFMLFTRVKSLETDRSHFLWYEKPGSDFDSGLAIGNGRLGAMVLGSAEEKIVLNENSVWSGKFLDRVNPNGLETLPHIRELLENGKLTEAGDSWLVNMSSIPNRSQNYSVTNDLLMNFGHSEDAWTNYKRWLDPMQGNAGVSYTYGGVNYTREYVANFEKNILAAQFRASKAASLSVDITLSRDQGVLELVADANAKTIIMNVGGNNASCIPFWSALLTLSDGHASAKDGVLTISNATKIDLFYNTETGFQGDSEKVYKAKLHSRLSDARHYGFSAIKYGATKDHRSLMGRVELDLGSSYDVAQLPTDARIDSYATNPDSDPELVTLMFQFGRHLLISSSRDFGAKGYGVPTNLQGIWNDQYMPSWGGKYTVNINTQMNYWLAETANLVETLPPLWDLMERSRERGKDVAERLYGCPGSCSHHNLDIWGDSAPHSNWTRYTPSALSGLWLASHMTEHYRFTGDKTFLSDRAWGVFYEAATFWNCFLFKFEGYWSSGPSASPENSFITPAGMSQEGSENAVDISPQFDTSLLYRFFSDLIEIADILGIDISVDKNISRANEFLRGLRPTQIGRYGQVQEWRNDYVEFDPGHRHLSHLWDLYPGNRMSPLINETLAHAARTSIERRLAAGGAGTGWSRIWTAACYARLFDGDAAYEQVQLLLRNHTMPNGFNGIDGKTVFQIDSNFGLVAAVVETLLQSHAGVVHLLPALASKLQKGSVKGLVARGGFVVSIAWRNGHLVAATIESKLGSDLVLRVGDGRPFKVNGRAAKRVKTQPGTIYTVTL